MSLEVIPISVSHDINEDDKLVDLVSKSNVKLKDGDILVVSQKIVSKQEGRIIQTYPQ